MNLESVPGRAHITRKALCELAGLTFTEVRDLLAEAARQDVTEHPRHGFPLEDGLRLVRDIREGQQR